MIDFEIPEETKLVRSIVREFVHDVCIPAEKGLTVDTYDEILAELRQKREPKDFGVLFSSRMGWDGPQAISKCTSADGIG